MRRVTQSVTVDIDERGIRVEGTQGDCYVACIASVFELPLEGCPGLGGNSQQVWNWLAANYPGVGMIVRDWTVPRDEPDRHEGFWIAHVLSPRFREPDCHHCTPDRRRRSRPPHFWRRDECPACDGTGHSHGVHAIVMEHWRPVWDPHPHVAGLLDSYKYVGETVFVVTDPARLQPRTLPSPSAS